MSSNHLDIQHDSRGNVHGFAYWSGMGAYYGYPPCCILNCLSRLAASAMAPVHYVGRGGTRVSYASVGHRERFGMPTRCQLDAANNTGFVPCFAHAEQLIFGHRGPETLLANRVCPAAFPASAPQDGGSGGSSDAYLRRYGPRGRRRSTLKPDAWKLT